MMKTTTTPLLAIRNAQAADASGISDMIVKCVEYYHVNNYSREGIEIWKRGYSPEQVVIQIQQRKCWVLEIEGVLAGVIQFQAPELKGFGSLKIIVELRFPSENSSSKVFKIGHVKSKSFDSTQKVVRAFNYTI